MKTVFTMFAVFPLCAGFASEPPAKTECPPSTCLPAKTDVEMAMEDDMLKSFMMEPKELSEPILAYYSWVNRYTMGTVHLSEQERVSVMDVGAGMATAKQTWKNCQYVLRNQYAADAIVDTQVMSTFDPASGRFPASAPAAAFGFLSGPGEPFEGVGVLPLADCILWSTVGHHSWGTGTNAAKNVRHCPGPDGSHLFKADVLPYKSGEGNFLQIPAEMFEVPRLSFLKGHLDANGDLVADRLTMCINGACDMSAIDYASEWTCGEDPW